MVSISEILLGLYGAMGDVQVDISNLDTANSLLFAESGTEKQAT